VAKIGNQPLGPPTLPANSVVNGAHFRPATEPNSAIAPGSIVSIFGVNFARSTKAADAVPLPTSLVDTSVTLNGIAAPLFFVSPTQINVQVPFDVQPGLVAVQIRRQGETSTTQTIGVAAVSPGIFSLNHRGTGQGAILISNTATFAARNGTVPGLITRPANRLEFISIYCTGLGDVTNRPPSGQVPSGGLSSTVQTPNVMIGGVAVQPSFSGLSSFVGLYQVNVQVPANTPTGDVVPVLLTIGGVSSNSVTIAVQ
jgi:uncharacterized protein (TIGR03437 family)